jgi:PKD repeat protein
MKRRQVHRSGYQKVRKRYKNETKSPFRVLLKALLFVLVFAGTVQAHAYAADFTLQWDPNSESNLAGYVLHYGTASGAYAQSIDVGTATTYKITGLRDGVDYYFAVTAYDTSDNESAFSNEVSGRKNLPPQATASAGPTQGDAPLTVSFSGSGSDQDGTIWTYTWDFGDGASASGADPVHVYTAAGAYTAVLTVADNDGATATASVQINVDSPHQAPTVNQPPTVQVSASPTSGRSPLAVTFTGQGTDADGSVVGYAWDLGDGSQSTQRNPSHTYNSEGTFTATLLVTDDDGATATASVQVQVLAADQPPSATAAASPNKGKPPLMVSFTGNGTDSDGAIASYRWDFGDGATSNERNPTHSYGAESLYTATLTVTDNDGATGKDSVKIRVNAPPAVPRGLKIGLLKK